MNVSKLCLSFLIITLFILTSLHYITPSFTKDNIETTLNYTNSKSAIRIVSNSSAVKIILDGGKKAKIVTKDELYSVLSASDFWNMIRVIRGETPSSTLLSKLKLLGINTLDPTSAIEILKTLSLLEPTENVFVTKYGIVNLKNAYARMEYWATSLEKADKDRNKISDYLDINTRTEVDIIIAAADRDLRGAMNEFKELGGEIIAIYPSIYAFRGKISSDKIPLLASKQEIGFIDKAPEPNDIIFNLRVSVPQIRVGTNDYKYYTISQYPSYSSTPWALGYTGTTDMTIAILDSGIDASHPELSGYGEAITYSTVLEDDSFTLPGKTTVWSNQTVNLIAGTEYYVSVSWSDTLYDYDIYIFPPDENSTWYTQSATQNNQFEHIYFEANETGTWKIAIKYRAGGTPSITGRLVVRSLSKSFSDNKIIGWRDFTHENRTTPYDGYGHGTFVASIVAGKGSNLTYQGVAYSAKIMGVRIFNSSGKLDADLYGVFEWLLRVIDDYNISVVLAAWTLDYVSPTLDEYVAKIVEKKALFVTAVGNEGYGGNIYSPATSEYAIVVGAVNDLNQLATYSTSNNPTYLKPDITAPGGSGIGTSAYTFDTSDENNDGYVGMIGAADSNDASWNFATPNPDDYTDLNGTSLAAAHVAGVINLIFDALGGYAGWQNMDVTDTLNIKAYLLATATEFPYGESATNKPTLDRGKKDRFEGYGRANADAAVMAATKELTLGRIYRYSLGSNIANDANQCFAPRAWAGKVYLEAGKSYRFYLDVPDTADFDLYIYSGANSYGEPVLVANSTNDYGIDECLNFQPTTTGYYIVVVKWIANPNFNDYENYGEFKLIIAQIANIGGTFLLSNQFEVYYVNTSNKPTLFIRVKNIPSSVDVKISLINETDNLPLLLTKNDGSIGEPELLEYSTPAYTKGLFINISATGSLSNSELEIFELISYLNVEQSVSILLDSAISIAVNFTHLKINGKYSYRASGNTGFSIYLVDSKGYDINSASSSTGSETGIDFTASASSYYGILHSSSSGSFTISLKDIGLPSITITTPNNNSYTNQTSITLSYFTRDIETNVTSVDIYYNGTPVGNEPINGSVQISGLYEGVWDIEFRVSDYAGNIHIVHIYVTVDLTLPEVRIISPSNNSYTNETSVSVSWEGIDNYGVSKYYVSTDGINWQEISEPSYTFTGLPEGNNTLYIKAIDLAGNSNITKIIIVVDITIPNVEVLSPSNFTYFNTTQIQIEWKMDDNIKLDKAILIVTNSSETITIELGLDTSYNINLADYFTSVEGTYKIIIKVYDKAQNSNSSFIIVYIDLTPPKFSSSNPEEGSYVNSTEFSFSWDFTDNFGIALYRVYVNDSLVYEGTNNNILITVDKEGKYNITIVAYDKAHNKAYQEIYLIIDITPPEIYNLSPSNYSYINSNYIEISWEASDNFGSIVLPYLVVIRNESGEIIAEKSTNEEMIPLQLDDGKYIIDIIAYDRARNKGIGTIIIIIDTKPPTVYLIKPEQDSVFTDYRITVEWFAEDNFNISYYVIKYSNYEINITDPSITNYEISLPYEGRYRIYVYAYDKAGNVGSAFAEIYIDLTPPQLLIISPSNGSYINKYLVDISWSASDNFEVAYSEISIDGGAFKNVGDNESYTALFTEGEHFVIIRVYDRAGLVNETKIIFVVDLTAPFVKIVSPKDGDLLNSSSVTVKYNASDNFALGYFAIYLNDLFMGKTSEFNYTIPVSSGLYKIKVVVFDKAGNSNYDIVEIKVDKEPPTLIIRRPHDGAQLTDKQVTVEWYSTDNLGIDHYEIKVDNKPWQNVGLRTIVVLTLEYGPHTIYVKAVDIAKNEVVEKITIMIVKPSTELSGPIVALMTLGIIITGAISITILNTKKNKKKKSKKRKFVTKSVNASYRKY